MLKFKLDDVVVTDVLSHTRHTLDNPAAMLADMGEHLVNSTQQRFRTSTAPDGSKWQANSQSTFLNLLGTTHTTKKGKINKAGTNRVMSKLPLVLGGTLRDEIHYQVSGDLLLVGSPMEYAAVQNFGAKAGEFGQTKFGVPLPFGDIPAREFIGMSDADRIEVTNIAKDHLLLD